MQVPIASKSEFARMIGVSPARITQMISEGLIGRDALVGEGRTAKVDVRRATAQIRSRRDIGQALGNGLGTRLDAEEPNDDQQDDDLSNSGPRLQAVGSSLRSTSTEDLIKLERLAAERRRNRLAEEEDAKRRGELMDAAQVRQAMSRLASRQLQIFEGGLADMAAALAAKFELPQRDILHELKRGFAAVRKMASEREAERASGLPELVETTIGSEDA